MSMEYKMQALYNTLDKLEVRGHDNAKRLAACMDYLKQMIDEANRETEVQEDETDDEQGNDA